MFDLNSVGCRWVGRAAAVIFIALGLVSLGFVTLGCQVGLAGGTITFTPGRLPGTVPRALDYDSETGILKVNLSKIPQDAHIIRAAFVLPTQLPINERPAEPTQVYPVGQPQRLLSFTRDSSALDATDLVQECIRSGRPLKLQVEGLIGTPKRLEVTLDRMPTRLPDLRVTDLRVHAHRAGQTFLLFEEPGNLVYPEFPTGKDFSEFRKKHKAFFFPLTYRVYRSRHRITPETIDQAELVGQVGRFSCWNREYHREQSDEQPPERFRVSDNGRPLPWGTGLFVHHPKTTGPAYYAVSVAAYGQEDFDQLGFGNTTSVPIQESVGAGEPILQSVETVNEFQGHQATSPDGIVLLNYVRWDSWPASVVVTPHNYLAAISLSQQARVLGQPSSTNPQAGPQNNGPGTSNPRKNGPGTNQPGTNQPGTNQPGTNQPGENGFGGIELSEQSAGVPVTWRLHDWGRNLRSGSGVWFDSHRGSVLLSANNIRYDWWTAYHEARDTGRTLGDGQVHPFTVSRLLAFQNWAARQHREAPIAVRPMWPRLNLKATSVTGIRLGGSGASNLGLRFGDHYAVCCSISGVRRPAQCQKPAIAYLEAYQKAYGPLEAKTTLADGKTSPWDYFDDIWWMERFPQRETALIIAAHAKNEDGDLWPQAVDYAKALQKTRRPHYFYWSVNQETWPKLTEGHDVVVRLDQSLPAFTNCTLDDDLGRARRLSDEQHKAQNRDKADRYDGAAEGQINGYLSWKSEDLVDQPDRWEITVMLSSKAPKWSCQVDLTPRRLQRFRLRPEQTYGYQVFYKEHSEEVGQATVDQDGLLTLRKIPLSKGPNRVKVFLQTEGSSKTQTKIQQ